MRSYEFKQQVKIAGKTFKRGVQEVSEEVEEHADFLSYAKCGWITDAEPKKVAAKAVTDSGLAKKIVERIAAQKEAKKNAPVREQKPEESPKVDFNEGIVGNVTTEPVGNEDDEPKLTPQQRAAITRKENAEKAKSESVREHK